ncbi:heterokaryon incompatibility protein-domain-containing protein [Xylariaceae sp. FL1272]|nr:heterokaryon incompatibility protein-domain-containing protein [Xylariaceae sp. FL1272]
MSTQWEPSLWEMISANRQPQPLRLADRDYLIVSLNESGGLPEIPGYRSELQKFDSDSLKKLKEYKYKRLPSDKKRIRLVQLMSGETQSQDIFCKFIEADYDETFHVPMQLKDDRKAESQEAAPAKTTLPECYQPGVDETDPKIKEQRQRHKKEKTDEWERRCEKVMNRTKAQKDQIHQDSLDELVAEWKSVSSKRIEYEALSWCWGNDDPEYAVKILEDDKTFKIKVRRDLALALKYLRKSDEARTLWIDAICINQDDPEERNHQVQMMSRIYTRAKQVCIWLGEDTHDSKVAIDFIRNEVMELQNFDMICSDKRYTRKWQALMMLMQAPWFSRRWVVQEIALARQAIVYCGKDWIPWKEFAVAVELFVEVETATHRLSEIMQKDEKFRHVPGWFEYVSELGASLLVQATGKVFRAQTTPLHEDKGKEETEEELRQRLLKVRTIDPLERRSLLSLEYLVSTMFTFKATEPRDVIYSLLAIARDAAPFVETAFDGKDQSILTMTLFDTFLEEKPFSIDYSRPYSDVCRDFLRFAIRRKKRLDPIQALDILCRPWALVPSKSKSIRLRKDRDGDFANGFKMKRMFPKWKQKWKIRTSEITQEETRDGSIKWKLIKKATDVRADDARTTQQYIEDIEKKKVWDPPPNCTAPWEPGPGWEDYETWCRESKEKIAADWQARKEQANKGDTEKDQNALNKTDEKDLPLPSWVAPASMAPFSLDHHPGMRFLKTGRTNADPLVGQPSDGHRNYSAAQTRHVNLDVLKFRKRPSLGHYSLYVQGFELDEVVEVMDASQGGNIPKSWLDLSGWKEGDSGYTTDPPDELWRTLVADRGRDNRNPPYYYARACKESVHKGSISSGRVDTTALINNERNSIVAEFCRRAHAVIWNRRMFKTKAGRLGLAYKVERGDVVAILYGCTVPVILTKRHKVKEDDDNEEIGDLKREHFEDGKEALKACIRQWEKNCERKIKRTPRIEKKKAEWLESGEWYAMMRAKKIAEKVLAKDAAEAEKKAKSSEDQDGHANYLNGDLDDELSDNADRDGEIGELAHATPDTGIQEQIMEETAGGDPSRDGTTSLKRKASHQFGKPSLKRRKTSWKQRIEEAEEQDPHLFYEFKGDCYLHGMMDGEAVREKFYMELPDRIFELR